MSISEIILFKTASMCVCVYVHSIKARKEEGKKKYYK